MVDSADEAARRIGENVRRARRARGMSLQILADRTSLSKGWLSLIENGKRLLDRRSHIAAIAHALEVSVGDLTGQPFFPPPEPYGAGGHTTIPRIRESLFGSSLDEPPDAPLRPAARLRERTGEVERLCQASDYVRLGRELPGLLPELQVLAVAGDERDRRDALRELVRACHATFYLLKDLGYLDLAQVAVQAARDAAGRLDDPVLRGLAAFVRVHALMPAGVYGAALTAATRAAADLQPLTGDRTARELYGMLHLSAALACVNLDRRAAVEAHIAEAGDTAERIGEGNAFGLQFGPTNVGFWQVTLLLELGEAERAADVAADLSPGRVSSAGRRATFFGDWGRALARLRHERTAIEKLRTAERLAPEQVRNNPLIRETVAHLLDSRRCASGARDLRGMAYRMGVT